MTSLGCDNKIKNRIIFKIKAEYCLELLPSDTQKLIGSRLSSMKIDRIFRNSALLIHCYLVNKDYQHGSRNL